MLPLATLAIAIAALYLYNLDGVGVLGPDEPRYAAIGRAMAASGDFVTPKLWGSPWFEKPPLLYWMTALGTAAGLGPELCGRLPVALLSLSFLGAMFVLTRAEFGVAGATVATALLATSAGWMADSGLCLTDAPLAIFFSLGVFAILPLLRSVPSRRVIMIRFVFLGVSLGLAVLAKGLVPIALTVPLLWFLRRYVRYWLVAIVSMLVVALPWYVLVYARNGWAFIDEFFVKHHLERLYSAALLHVQPPYYYLPVLLAALFPWTPLLGLLFGRAQTWDARRRCLLSIALFGLFFFSISRNKLPGYLLPLLPVLFVLIGSTFEGRRADEISRGWLAACAVLIGTIPFIGILLPEVLAAGRLSAASSLHLDRTASFFVALPIFAVFLARRSWMPTIQVLCVVAGVIYLKAVAFPVIDDTVSARSLWRELGPKSEQICDGGTNRDWLYGLQFYRGKVYPDCGTGHFRLALRTERRGRPDLIRLP